jgi:MFS family permease
MLLRRSKPRYGWVVTATLAVTETISWGILFYGFPVMLKPMEAELRWSRVALTGAFSVALATQGLAALLVGRWLDRHSPRGLMTAGSLAAALGVWLWAQVGTLVGFYLLWAALGAVMATVLYEPAFTVVAKWFTGADRRWALTAVTLVAGLASFVFLPLENALIEAYGWRRALEILAVVLAVTTVPLHALVLRQAPAPVETAAPSGGEEEAPSTAAADAFRTPTFRLLAAAWVGFTFVMSGLAAHQVAYLIERGFTDAFAAFATGMLGAMQLGGRLLFAPLLGVLPRRHVTTLTFVALLSGLAILAAGSGPATVWLFIVIYGAARGMGTLLRATLVAELFGSAHYGAISGTLSLIATAAQAAAPVAVGALYQVFSGYQPVLWTLVGVVALAAVAASHIEAAGGGVRVALKAAVPPDDEFRHDDDTDTDGGGAGCGGRGADGLRRAIRGRRRGRSDDGGGRRGGPHRHA